MKIINTIALVCALAGTLMLAAAAVISHNAKQHSARVAAIVAASKAWSEAVDPLLEDGPLFDLLAAMDSAAPPAPETVSSADELRVVAAWQRRKAAAVIRAQQRLDKAVDGAAEVLRRAIRDADSKGNPAWPSREQGLKI